MTETQQLVTGRELDALVAEKVMGWDTKALARAAEFEEVNREAFNQHGRSYWVMEAYQGEDFGVPFYSTDIAAAWRVIERLRTEWLGGLRVELSYGEFAECRIISTLGHGRIGSALANTIPMAICAAALKAHERFS